MLHPIAQPQHLVVVKHKAREKHVGGLKRSGDGVGLGGDIAIGEGLNLEIGATRDGTISGLTVQIRVKGLKTGDEDDARHDELPEVGRYVSLHL
jgi:hypothetical protein